MLEQFDKSTQQKYFDAKDSIIFVEGETVAEILTTTHSAWWQDKDFLNTELGEFISFIKSMKWVL